MLKFKKIFFLIILFFPFYSSADINKKYDVVAIGEAMVDIIDNVSDEELIHIMPAGFKKADTRRVDKDTADTILAKMKDYIIIPGGSEANVIVNIASLGGKTAFNTVIADDKFGRLFKESLTEANVEFLSPFLTDSSKSTALCFTFITPNKNRTFAVFSNISSEINDNFVNYDAIKNSKIFYTDASDIDNDGPKSKVINKAITAAESSSTLIAFNLNNSYFAEINRDEIISLLPKIDIIIGNEPDSRVLFKTDNLEDIINNYLKHSQIVIITQEEKGAIIATKDKRFHIPTKVLQEKIIDLNGAGDAFAGGFLYGYTHGYSLEESSEIAAQTAAKIIYQTGPRPQN